MRKTRFDVLRCPRRRLSWCWARLSARLRCGDCSPFFFAFLYLIVKQKKYKINSINFIFVLTSMISLTVTCVPVSILNELDKPIVRRGTSSSWARWWPSTSALWVTGAHHSAAAQRWVCWATDLGPPPAGELKGHHQIVFSSKKVQKVQKSKYFIH